MVHLPRLALRGWRKGCEEESELKIGQGGRAAPGEAAPNEKDGDKRRSLRRLSPALERYMAETLDRKRDAGARPPKG